MLTSYDQYTAAIFDEAGIPVLLVGDSAANNVFGYETTLPVTVDELLPLVRAVVRRHQARAGRRRPAVRLVRGGPDAGAAHRRAVHEGGRLPRGQARGRPPVAAQIAAITGAGIPVMAHIGFTPQSEHALGGYRVQGRGDDGRRGAAPTRARSPRRARSRWCWRWCRARSPSRSPHELAIPTIGIGAGPDTDAQVLVWQDMAGLRDAARRRASSSGTPTWPAC